jgi:NAD(P)-dependent dehydrogenase (short-subunit alcohol dehydrogenase family)/rhamnose utilization protein RhaD (predicted bifunctional aldolase and dehydrogenase)
MVSTTWNEQEAGPNGPAQLVYALRLLARAEGISLRGRCYSSIKVNEHDLFDEEKVVLNINRGIQDFEQLTIQDLMPLEQANLEKIASHDLIGSQLENELARSRVDASTPLPSEDALWQAVLPAGCILTVRSEALLTVALLDDAARHLHQVFGDEVVVIGDNQDRLVKAFRELVTRRKGNLPVGILLPDHNLAVVGTTVRAAYENLLRLVSLARTYLVQTGAWELDLPEIAPIDTNYRFDIANLRKNLSESAGCPLILSVDSSPLARNFTQRPGLEIPFPPSADQQSALKDTPMVGRNLDDYLSMAGFSKGNAAPRLILDDKSGLLTAGRTAEEAKTALELYRQGISAILKAEKFLRRPLAAPVRTLANLVPAKLFQSFSNASTGLDFPTLPGLPGKVTSFTGEVALVTGGASGIGKACVESLLKRGAAVVTMDINPSVTTLFEREDFLGLVCDLTDEAAIIRCFETMTRRFGGLDMLVLNAGIFPAGIRIEALETTAWQKVMRINLDSNLVIMREAQPLLKTAPRYGRVLVNASKNVLAPGAGAAAYSASKAAVTQLARVAALEWGKDKIRVNLVHPDAIFDTGIWTEEVLKARAAHYGMTVQQYKTRNVLGVELNSHYVGELVAEMLGPLFEKITGAQIPVDGGSDRVI